MPITVASSDDPGWVLAKAKAFLASDPVQHNLVLTLLHKEGETGRYWVAMDGGVAAGIVMQSRRGIEATLTPMEPAVVAAIAAAIAESDAVLPGVNGDAATVARFAGTWAEHRNVAAIPYYGQRLYELGQFQAPPVVSGRLREAVADDRDLLIEWVRGFQAEVAEHGNDPARVVDRKLPFGLFWLWDDGQPAVSMAAYTEPVEGVARVQAVYTPPGMRNRGYASACVAALSKMLRAAGHRPILYTDLANPASNAIYRRLGYRAVAEGLRYRFR